MIDSFKIAEIYQWHDDLMEITRAIVRGTDEARLVNIADHFEVDLSEIREWIEEKKKRKFAKPQTNADRIRAMSGEELAAWFIKIQDDTADYIDGQYSRNLPATSESWALWLKSPADKEESQ